MVDLDWLKDDRDKYRLDILTYCLMTHPIHFVAVFEMQQRLPRVLKPPRLRDAPGVNRWRGWKGQMWQTKNFIPNLEKIAGQSLQIRPPGRSKKENGSF